MVVISLGYVICYILLGIRVKVVKDVDCWQIKLGVWERYIEN